MGRYLVAGAAGFIGARVSELLLSQGNQVVGVDNLDPAYDVRMKEYRVGRLNAHPGFQFLRLDISEQESIGKLTQVAEGNLAVGVSSETGQVATSSSSGHTLDGIFNLAARAGVRASVENPWSYLAANETGSLNLLEVCRRVGVPKYILASTSSVYGLNAPLPTPETATSDLPLQPYAASKKGAEVMAHAYHYLYGIDITVFRYFTVYGPAGRPDMSMFRFVKWISEGEKLHLNGDGTQSRGFTFIDDIARGTIQGLKPVGYQVINLGGHEVITMNGLIRMLEERIGRKATIVTHPFHPADMTANHADVTKAGKLLGWEPQVGLEEGVNRLVSWYQAEREWVRHIRTD